MTFELNLNDALYTFTVVKKPRQRRIIVTAKAPNTFLVTAPRSVRKKDIIDVIETHQEQLLRMKPPVDFKEAFIDGAEIPVFDEVLTLYQLPSKRSTHRKGTKVYFYGVQDDAQFKKRTHAWLKAQLASEIERLVSKYQHAIKGIDLTELTMRYQYMKTKFGSCQPTKKRMSFNLELVHYPKVFTEYIFLHEVSHLAHADHSKAFYAFFETLCPNHKTYRRAINSLRKRLLNEGFEGLIDRDKA